MNLPYFISKRITKKSQGTFANSIHQIAIYSIAIGLTALLMAFMILGGFQNEIRNKIFSFSGHLLITKYTLSSSFEESSIQLNDTLINVLEDLDFVDNWQFYAYKAGLLKTEDEVQGVFLKGLDNTFDTAYFSKNIIRGRFPNFEDEGYSTEVAISNKISKYLKLGVGDKVLIYFVQNPPRYRNLEITGIYETGLEEFDEKIILGDINLVRRINDWDKSRVGGVEVFVKDHSNLYDYQEELFFAIGKDLYVENVEDKYLQIFDWLSLLNRNVIIFLVLILFVASFSMVSIILILIMERTQMIGVLKAMGGSNGLIRKIFVTSGVSLIVRGLGWGNFVAFTLAAIQYKFKVIPLDPENYYMSFVPIEFDFGIIIWLNLLTLLLISLSLLIPVAIIARIHPIKAIRFD